MSADDRVWNVTLLLAQHQRLDPMGRNDRCTCGFKTALGRMFSEHIAKLVDAMYSGDSA